MREKTVRPDARFSIMISLKTKIGRKNLTIFSYTGLLVTGIGVLLLVPLLTGFLVPFSLNALRAFLLPSAISILAGLLIWRIFRPDCTTALTTPDAAVIVTLIWIVAVAAGAAPFIIGNLLSTTDAIFESMSGWTTTGLTMVIPENIPEIYLMWRSFMQFVGGAGLAVIMLSAIIGALGPGVYEAEARTDHLMPHVIHTARMIMKIYLAYFLLGVGLYLLTGLQPFDAICHTMSGLATGGFSTHSESIGYWNQKSVQIVTLLLMIIGSTNFATHHAILVKRKKKAYMDAELLLMFVLITIGTFLIFMCNRGNGTNLLSASFFQTVSAISGTGYTTISLSNWRTLPIFILVIFMLIEGGTGSTAGGIKLYRAFIVMKSMYWWTKRQLYPASAVIQRTIWRRGEKYQIQDKHIQAVAGFVGIYLITYILGVMVLLADGFSLNQATFEFASAMGTVGLSLGITSPEMPMASKIAEIVGMWLGRLEFAAIFLALIRLLKGIIGK